MKLLILFFVGIFGTNTIENNTKQIIGDRQKIRESVISLVGDIHQAVEKCKFFSLNFFWMYHVCQQITARARVSMTANEKVR
jgi:hypothetical protein